MSNWGIRRVAAALLVTYIGAATAVVLWPTPVDGGLKSQLKQAILQLQDAGAPEFVNYGFIESAANVVFFVPLGILLTMMVAQGKWWVAPLMGMTLSTAAEVAQLLFLPHRFATLADVAANTSGAIVGTVVVLAARGTLFAVARLGADRVNSTSASTPRSASTMAFVDA